MADQRIKLISDQQVKDITPIGENVDVRKFAHNIFIAQDLHIKSLIGKPCFDDLLEQKDADSLSAANTTLLNDYLIYALAWWTLYLSYPDLYAAITPTGVQTKSGDDYATVSSSMLQILINNAKAKAEYYSQQAICFMNENSNDYPCMNEDGGCCVKRESTGYSSSGIILDDEMPIKRLTSKTDLL